MEEIIEKQGDRTEEYKMKGDRHFTDEERVAEMFFDLVLKARVRMAEERVNGPEGSIVTEMMKQVPQDKQL